MFVMLSHVMSSEPEEYLDRLEEAVGDIASQNGDDDDDDGVDTAGLSILRQMLGAPGGQR